MRLSEHDLSYAVFNLSFLAIVDHIYETDLSYDVVGNVSFERCNLLVCDVNYRLHES